jgi:hypothetical protein
LSRGSVAASPSTDASIWEVIIGNLDEIKRCFNVLVERPTCPFGLSTEKK